MRILLRGSTCATAVEIDFDPGAEVHRVDNRHADVAIAVDISRGTLRHRHRVSARWRSPAHANALALLSTKQRHHFGELAALIAGCFAQVAKSRSLRRCSLRSRRRPRLDASISRLAIADTLIASCRAWRRSGSSASLLVAAPHRHVGFSPHFRTSPFSIRVAAKLLSRLHYPPLGRRRRPSLRCAALDKMVAARRSASLRLDHVRGLVSALLRW